MSIPQEIRIPHRRLKMLVHDTARSAECIHLTYVNDSEPGISRRKRGSGFSYHLEGKLVRDKEVLRRIRGLVLPPAWRSVWICSRPDGHLQATGIDAAGRKQYRYHPLWNSLRSQTKFYHMQDFGRALPLIRQQLKRDLALPGLQQRKVLATIVMLMQCTCIRIGSALYEKLYGSYGLTTLKDKHVSIDGTVIHFSFKGKKGVYQDITLKSKKLAGIVKQCRDIPGKELFQYYDEAGRRHTVDSGMVNSYIKEISNGHFSAKDFRTWAGTLHALEAFRELGPATSVTETKKNIIRALDMVAGHLGNTRAVCKKYYVHPLVIDKYAEGKLQDIFGSMTPAICPASDRLSQDELLLLSLLDKTPPTVIAA